MISIKKFLNMPEVEGVSHQVILTLLEGISEHSTVGEAAEYEHFQADLLKLVAQLKPETTPGELLLIAGRAIKALQEHTARTASLILQQTEELRTIVEMLTRTIEAISAASSKSGGRLVAMQRDLKETSAIDDVRVLKSKISDCLKGIEAEVEEQSRETGVTVSALRKQLQNSTAVLASASLDPLTRLRTYAQAEEAIAEACRSAVQTYAVLFVLDRVEMINDRFGREMGDQALRAFKDFIMRDARPEDQFFRWGGPAFLVLLQRKESVEWLRSSVARSVSKTFEMNVETNARNLMLSLSCHWAVFPMVAAPRQLIAEIQAFASARAGPPVRR
jgi:diguanylate cyclase (GGDEF)-like protein